MLAKEHSYEDSVLLDISQDLNRWLNYLLLVTVFTFILGMITFGEPYSFYKHAYSYFGRIRTPNGNSNILSFLIFSCSSILSAYICLHIDRILHGGYNHNLFKICAVGYLLMLTPCDIYNPLHMVGAAIVFASLWLFAVIRLVQLIPSTGIIKFIVYQLVLQGTVLPYAFFYAIDSPAKQMVQKIALFGLIAALKFTVIEFRKAVLQKK